MRWRKARWNTAWVVLSPGLAPTLPPAADLLREAEARGIEVVGEIEVFARARAARAGQHDGLRTDADVGAGQRTKRGRGLAQFEHLPHFFFHRQAQAAEFRRDRQAEETQFAHFVDDGGRDLAA
ncbi:hypothetical protein G6F64_014110 [Rhizopus arrhizus]|uniref:Uncharacterized protein n=1 Tax=Rhizopus oryzae TaxID=64495 RepID=A0A9P6WU69_RHIOR|nr:hypothetical protein G6F64_014110 [Rhizopus arrhizus]